MDANNLEIRNWIIYLLKNNSMGKFYKSRKWLNLRAEIISQQNSECQICKSNGIYSRGSTVHHVNELKDRPDLALSEYDENGNKNLILVCKNCHNKIHDRIFPIIREESNTKMVNKERW